MKLPEHLLEQADALIDPASRGRPRQADLRRAVSAAYYALFHFLIDEACTLMLGARAHAGLGNLMRRAFDHGPMKQVSESFSAKLKPAHRAALGGVDVPPPLQRVAAAFFELQKKRHEADYNLGVRFIRRDVRKLVDQARDAIGDWERIRDSDAARVYLLLLLIGSRIRE